MRVAPRRLLAKQRHTSGTGSGSASSTVRPGRLVDGRTRFASSLSPAISSSAPAKVATREKVRSYATMALSFAVWVASDSRSSVASAARAFVTGWRHPSGTDCPSANRLPKASSGDFRRANRRAKRSSALFATPARLLKRSSTVLHWQRGFRRAQLASKPVFRAAPFRWRDLIVVGSRSSCSRVSKSVASRT